MKHGAVSRVGRYFFFDHREMLSTLRIVPIARHVRHSLSSFRMFLTCVQRKPIMLSQKLETSESRRHARCRYLEAIWTTREPLVFFFP